MSLIAITPELVARLLPVRPKNATKEDFGRVLVIAGSQGMSGAAMLCSRAVLRAGAGLAILGIPQSLARLADVSIPEVMALELPETKTKTLAPKAFLPIKKVASRVKVLALGPGLSRKPSTVQLVKKVLKSIPKKFPKIKLVIDADGLAGLVPFSSQNQSEYLPIITPHTGELAKLLKVTRKLVEKDPPFYARKAAKRYKVLVVLKSFQTIIVSPYEEEILFNNIGNAGMATGGTGDVLTGTIAGFLAQGLDSWTAAVVGVYIHSLAGNVAAIRVGQDGIIASDILESLPLAIKRIRGK